jgi:hypothetical protein
MVLEVSSLLPHEYFECGCGSIEICGPSGNYVVSAVSALSGALALGPQSCFSNLAWSRSANLILNGQMDGYDTRVKHLVLRHICCFIHTTMSQDQGGERRDG